MQEKRFSTELMSKPFKSYDEYMSYIFACVNYRLSDYIEGLMKKYDAGQGNYKNVMYPDIEIAHDLCRKLFASFCHHPCITYSKDTINYFPRHPYFFFANIIIYIYLYNLGQNWVNFFF